MAQDVGVLDAPPENQGFFGRMGQSMRAGMPLSAMQQKRTEAAMARDPRYMDPVAEARIGYYNRAGRGSGKTSSRSLRGLEEIYGILDSDEGLSEQDRALLQKAARAEAQRYFGGGGTAGSGQAQLQGLIEEYQSTSDPRRAAELEELLETAGVQFN